MTKYKCPFIQGMEGNGGMNRGTSGALTGGMNEDTNKCISGYLIGVLEL
jgi:hypothetical protein